MSRTHGHDTRTRRKSHRRRTKRVLQRPYFPDGAEGAKGIRWVTQGACNVFK